MVCDDTPLLCQRDYPRTHFAYVASVAIRSSLFPAVHRRHVAHTAVTVTCHVSFTSVTPIKQRKTTLMLSLVYTHPEVNVSVLYDLSECQRSEAGMRVIGVGGWVHTAYNLSLTFEPVFTQDQIHK
jgi:hypothetical protein